MHKTKWPIGLLFNLKNGPLLHQHCRCEHLLLGHNCQPQWAVFQWGPHLNPQPFCWAPAPARTRCQWSVPVTHRTQFPSLSLLLVTHCVSSSRETVLPPRFGWVTFSICLHLSQNSRGQLSDNPKGKLATRPLAWRKICGCVVAEQSTTDATAVWKLGGLAQWQHVLNLAVVLVLLHPLA